MRKRSIYSTIGITTISFVRFPYQIQLKMIQSDIFATIRQVVIRTTFL